MKIFGFQIGRQKATGAVVSVPAVRGVSYFLGPIMESFGGAWQRNITAETTENLLRFSPVYACASRIASDISILRPMLMRETPDDITVEIKEARSAYMPIIKRPNPYMNWIQFLQYWILCKLFYGNAYAIKDRDARGVVAALYPVDPRLVKPKIASDGSVYYDFGGDFLARIPEGESMLPASEVVHDRMNTFWHPLVGVPPIYAAAASGTQGIRIQSNSETFFSNMSRPSGQLTAPGMIDDATAARLKKQFEEGFSGAKLGRLFVSGNGLKFEPINVPAEQAQLIEQLRWTVEDVARCFGVPLHKIQAGAMPTFTNIGALNQQYYDESLKPHIEAFELLMTQEVVMKKEYSVELDLSGLLRMDPKTRAERIEILMRAGAMTPDEARASENLPPVDGGNTPYMQQQNYSLAALAKRDKQDDPFGTAKPAAPALPAPGDEEDEDDDAEAIDDETRAFIDAITKGLPVEATV